MIRKAGALLVHGKYNPQLHSYALTILGTVLVGRRDPGQEFTTGQMSVFFMFEHWDYQVTLEHAPYRHD